MKNVITFTFCLLIFISCKQKEAENKPEIVLTEKSENKKETENLSEKIVTEYNADCDLKTLVEINSLLEKGTELNDQNFAVFFANMNPHCSNNAEYSEFNNELIFKMLESNPKKFVAFLSRVSKKIRSREKTDFVLNELKNPTNDLIDLTKLELGLKNTKTENEELKVEILKSLKIAEQKEK